METDRPIKRIYADIDLKGNKLANFVIGDVDELPKTADVGRIVMYEGHPYIFEGKDWEKVTNEIDESRFQAVSEKNAKGGYAGLDENGNLGTDLIKIENTWAEAPTDTQIPSAKLVKSALDSKLDSTDIAKDLSKPTENQAASTLAVKNAIAGFVVEGNIINDISQATADNIPSAKLMETELGDKLSIASLDTSELSDSAKVAPSSKLTITELGKKVGKNQIDSAVSTDPNKVPSSKAVSDALSQTLKTGDIDTDPKLDHASDSKVPSTSLLKTVLSDKTDKYMAIPMWDSSTQYRAGSTVIKGRSAVTREGVPYETYNLFIAKENNKGMDPNNEGKGVWTTVEGNSGSSSGTGYKSYRYTITDTTPVVEGTPSTYNIIHGFNSFDLFWSIREHTAQGDAYILADIKIKDKNSIYISFTKKVSEGQSITVLLRAFDEEGPKPEPPVYPVSEVVAFSQPAKTWEVENKTHNPLYVKTFDDDGQEIRGNINQNNLTKVSVDFETPHTGSMVVSEVEDTRSKKFEDATEVKVEHNLGRFVGVEIFSLDGQEMRGDIVQAPDRMSVTVFFNQPASGTVIVV